LKPDIIVYTACFGKFDKPGKPLCRIKSADWVYYTDQDIHSSPWHVNKVMNQAQNRNQARLKARYYKTHPSEDYEYTVWVDSNAQLKVDPRKLILQLGQGDILVHRHKFRKTIKEEAHAVVTLKRVNRGQVGRQVQVYTREGFIKQVPLPETGILVRANNDRVTTFNEMWWDNINRYCVRDQMSFGYCAWKAKLKIVWFSGCIQDDTVVRLRAHGS